MKVVALLDTTFLYQVGCQMAARRVDLCFGFDQVRVYVHWSSQPKFAKLNCDIALRSCLLSESLQVTTFKQLPEYHNCGEDIKKCLYVVATLQTKDNDEVYLSDMQ
ncbi:hypothetical protein HanHA89_Chr12g0463611 [Helianthus annuus]|nr:hypothetical protein HanHA89_Chr12g0463611 [Helianthus annuus]